LPSRFTLNDIQEYQRIPNQMSSKIAVFWPGDYRSKPNEWALDQSQEATTQIFSALKKLGKSPYLVEGYLGWLGRIRHCSWRQISQAHGPAWWPF
jgi:hypothetical protein